MLWDIMLRSRRLLVFRPVVRHLYSLFQLHSTVGWYAFIPDRQNIAQTWAWRGASIYSRQVPYKEDIARHRSYTCTIKPRHGAF